MSELEKGLKELRDIGFANEEQIRSQCLSIIDLIDGRKKPDYYTSIAQRHQQLITGSSVGQLEAVVQDVLAVALSRNNFSEVKVTSCQECPMHVYEDEHGEMHTCRNGAFKNQWFLNHEIHSNCLIKGGTILFKIG